MVINGKKRIMKKKTLIYGGIAVLWLLIIVTNMTNNLFMEELTLWIFVIGSVFGIYLFISFIIYWIKQLFK